MTKARTTALAMVAFAYAFLFRDVLAKLVYDWGADQNYSHGFLMVPLAAYVVWQKRAELAALPRRPSTIGLLVIVASLLTLVAGIIGAELFLTRVALLGTLAGAVVFVLGRRHLKELGFAFLLLALAIPIPAIIFNQITFPLQLLASRFGEAAISACQIPVLREGNIITLATTSLEVAEACSGIRSLVSLVTLAVIWGYLSDSPMWLRWLLAASSVPIAIFANGIRVAGTGIAAHFAGPAAAQGFFHTFSGWLVFVVAALLMLIVHRLGTRFGPAARAAAPGEPVRGAAPAASATADLSQDRGILTRSSVVFGCLMITALILGAVTRTEAIALREPLKTLPLRVGAWDGQNAGEFDPEIVATLGVDESLNRSYAAPGRPWVGLYIGYYRSQRQGQTMHSPMNCMPGSGWQPSSRSLVEVPIPPRAGTAGGNATVNRLVIQKGLDRLLVLYWYQAHGRIVASEYWGKIYTVLDAIRLNRSDGALVRVIVPIASQDAEAEAAAERTAIEFVSTLMPVLSTYLDR
jgi:exosortase D (VPLPA-CTERM-specific)